MVTNKIPSLPASEHMLVTNAFLEDKRAVAVHLTGRPLVGAIDPDLLCTQAIRESDCTENFR